MYKCKSSLPLLYLRVYHPAAILLVFRFRTLHKYTPSNSYEAIDPSSHVVASSHSRSDSCQSTNQSLPRRANRYLGKMPPRPKIQLQLGRGMR